MWVEVELLFLIRGGSYIFMVLFLFYMMSWVRFDIVFNFSLDILYGY